MFSKLKAKSKLRKLENLAHLGDEQAMYDLAMVLINGEIDSVRIKKNREKAFTLLETASQSGHLQSRVFLKSNDVIAKVKSNIKKVDDILGAFMK